MKTQTCSICNKEKNVEEFNFRNKEKNIRHYNCKDCVKISRKKSYNKNAEYYKDKSKRRRKEHANLYDEYKKTLSCKICGESESVCLDFHHIEPNEKEYNIALLKYSTGSFEKVKREIEKCVVLCANCQRKVHAGIIRLDGVIG